MKKLVCMLICASMVLVLCACGSSETSAEKETAAEASSAVEEMEASAAAEAETAQDTAADNYTDATEYEITISDGQEVYLSNLRFNEDLVITGSSGRVIITDCEFNGNIINRGGEGSRVILAENIAVYDGFRLVIDSEVKEGTMESDMPKFMVFSGNYPVECTNAGGVVSTTKEEISFNGVKYGMDSCDYYMKESTGEFVEYSGQDAAYHNICRWFENGEEIIMSFAIDE